MYCNICGEKLPDNSTFCIRCGARVAASAKKEAQAQPDTTYRYVPPRGTTREVIYGAQKKPNPVKSSPPGGPGCCRYCGAKLKPDLPFCNECGKAVSAPPKAAEPSSPAKASVSTSAKKPKKKNVFGSLYAAAVVVLVCWALNTLGEKAGELLSPSPSPSPTATPAPIEPTMSPAELDLAERLPDVPEQFRTLRVLQHRGVGSCKELTGEVAITVIFADDAASGWTEWEMDEFMQGLQSGAGNLIQQAAQWGVALNITFYTGRCTLEQDIVPQDAYLDLNAILTGAGYEPYGLGESRKAAAGADAAPFVVAFNKNGRSYATQGTDKSKAESCYLFGGNEAFEHELLHLFGAADFYYHDYMKYFVNDALGGSIMVDSANEKVDDLTAYLVGWTDELTGPAANMLYAIDYIGNAELQEAQEENTFTGYGTLNYDDGTTYEGYMTVGVPDGWGEMVFANGNTYCGEFKNGVITGYGTFIWTNGDRYDGDFLDGELHGQGTLVFANGAVSSGTWNNGTFIG